MDEWLDEDTNVNVNIFVHMIIVHNKSWDLSMVKSDDDCCLWLLIKTVVVVSNLLLFVVVD